MSRGACSTRQSSSQSFRPWCWSSSYGALSSKACSTARSRDSIMDETIGNEALHPLKSRPRGTTQHVTAGPYSPALQVDARHLVVISGQVAVDMDGNVVGDTIEEQAAATLQNCERQLATADCGLRDVFKVNVYLADLRHWARFNASCEKVMVEPLPVRTAVRSALLPGFLVEIEMWAVAAKGS
ncbi:RidA family protein [Mesorhizobium sp. M00.F.Ca.ET.216.01.1.1]|nr:RidA family protein [Mesorhizobium sp. M00.F.Ca.ET.216.01.1.1]